MTTRRTLLHSIPAASAAYMLGETLAPGGQPALAQDAAATWRSPSLVEETVTAANGAITNRTAIEADERWGTAPRAVTRIADGVYLLSGWGLAASMAIEAPEGWIIVDTGDSTRAAADMREHLERAVGGRIKVAAVLLTHWHYADGTAAWLDEGAELWGHEWLDANRMASSGVSIKSGFYQARAIAQFGVLHPSEGPDAFPNELRFTPEKLIAVSSYQPPTRLFTHGKVETFMIAGAEVEVAPNRSDTSDSVGFYFVSKRTLVTNFMAPGGIFNVYSLRGGPFRNPLPFLQDSRWMESKNAEILLDVHSRAITGEASVRAEIQRAADQVQLIHDQALRMIARGFDGREAAENVHMPRHQREGWENYGQVESHVRQIYSGTVGWFGHDVYDINPLSLRDEAARTIEMSGGVEKVRAAAAAAANEGGIANWQWALRLTSLLLRLDPQDKAARQARATAARAISQRTTTANGRGWYMTEALAMEGRLAIAGKSVTLDMVRSVLGTPSLDDLMAAPVAANLDFLRYLVDPRKAEDQRFSLTFAITGEPGLWSLELRNGVLVTGPAETPAPSHAELSRNGLAEFVLGLTPAPGGNAALAGIDSCLDRSGFLMLPEGLGDGLDDPAEKARILVEGEH